MMETTAPPPSAQATVDDDTSQAADGDVTPGTSLSRTLEAVPASSTTDHPGQAQTLLLVAGLFLSGGIAVEVAFNVRERRYR